MQNSDPWYTRSEFWATLATHLLGIAAVFGPVPPIVQTIGAGMGMLAPIVYTFGRGNVKAQQAAAALGAVAQTLTPK